MSSFLSKFKAGATNTSTANGSIHTKKDPNAPLLTPLEKLLADAGPDREDGSDKVFGMENFGSTCYYNSIIQCLYHSPPFRDNVLNYPTPISPPKRRRISHKHTQSLDSIGTESNGSATSLGMAKVKSNLTTSTALPVKKPMSPPTQPPQSPNREENKDSSEYKKKMALHNGPIIHLDHGSGNKYGMKESLFTSLRDMFEAMSQHESRNGVVSPRRPTDLVRALNSVFSVPMHQDAHECLNFVLNQVVEDLEKNEKEIAERSTDVAKNDFAATSGEVKETSKNNPRWIHELFEGVMSSEITCLTCQRTSSREEAYLDLSVDLGLYSSVNSCLLKFSEEEMLNEKNKFHCDSCNGLQEAEKRMKIKKTPRILALHLKRFTYTEDLQRLQKLHHRVAYPYHLRLSNLTDESTDQDKLYELYAVVVHIGMSPYQGHYVSIIKTQSSGWLLFDDENVEPVDKDFVRTFFGSENGLACAYVLFYTETTYEDAQREMDEEDKSSSVLSTIRAREPPTIVAKTNAGVAAGSTNVSSAAWTDDPNFSTGDLQPPPVPPKPTPSNATKSVTSQGSSGSPLIPFMSRKKNGGAAKVLAEQDESENGSVVGSQTNVSQGEDPNETARKAQPNGAVTIARKQIAKPANAPGRDDGYDGSDWPTADDGTKDDASSSLFSGSINRFKSTSKTVKGKTKLWNSMLGKDIPAVPTSPAHAQPGHDAQTGTLSSTEFNRPRSSRDDTGSAAAQAYDTVDGDAHNERRQSQADRPSTARTVTPTALPTYQKPAGDSSKKKDKRSFFGLGKKKH